MTAEQFVDAVWQITEAGPARYDVPVLRGKPEPNAAAQASLQGKWIWSRADSSQAAAGETVAFRKQFALQGAPAQAVAVISCDNSYQLFVNGQRAQAGDDWQRPDSVLLAGRLKPGENEFLIVAKNGGASPNPAGLFFEARLFAADGSLEAAIASDDTWQWTRQQPERNGRYKNSADRLAAGGARRSSESMGRKLAGDAEPDALPGRAISRVDGPRLAGKKRFSDAFARPAQSRPDCQRAPNELTTLEAISLSNGQILADTLARGSKKLLARPWQSPQEFIGWLYRFALSRQPTPEELELLVETLGKPLNEQGVQDVLWAVIMLPEFHLVR